MLISHDSHGLVQPHDNINTGSSGSSSGSGSVISNNNVAPSFQETNPSVSSHLETFSSPVFISSTLDTDHDHQRDQSQIFNNPTIQHQNSLINNLHQAQHSSQSWPSKNSVINVPTPAPTLAPAMEFQVASGKIRMPVTFQYGFEPMTSASPGDNITPKPFLKSLSKPPTPAPQLHHPLPIRQHSVRPFLRRQRRVRPGVVEFYQRENIVDRLSSVLRTVSRNVKDILS